MINEKRLLLQADVYELTSGKTVTVKSDRAVFERSFYKVSMAEMQKSIRPGYPALITVSHWLSVISETSYPVFFTL